MVERRNGIPHLMRLFAFVLLGLASLGVTATSAIAQVAPTAAERAGYTGLFAAATRGDAAAVARLVAEGASVSARDGYGRTPLHVAAYASQQGAMRALVAGRRRSECARTGSVRHRHHRRGGQRPAYAAASRWSWARVRGTSRAGTTAPRSSPQPTWVTWKSFAS
jgi:hypothetical protein